MCGISFFINYNIPSRNPLNLSMMTHVFTELEKRGKDASGYYFERYNKNNILEKQLIKAPVPASSLLEMIEKDDTKKAYRLTGKEKLVLFHTRFATTGSEMDNNNNHPIVSKNYVLIHNGTVTTTTVLPNYDYQGQVDSEKILAHIETDGLVEGLSKVWGSVAIAFKKFNGSLLYVYKSNNPLYLIYLCDDNILIGVSDDDYIPKPDTPLYEFLFRPNVSVVNLPSDTLYGIALKKHGLLKIAEIKRGYGG